MATAVKGIALAKDAVTVHVKLASEPTELPDGTQVWDIESKVLEPGATIPLSDLPPYLVEAIKGGTAPGLEAITEAQMKKVAAFKAAASELDEEQEKQEDDPNFPAEEY